MTARPLRERVAFLPVGHRDDAEPFGEPRVSKRLTFGDVHPDLITFLGKQLRNRSFLRILLFSSPHHLPYTDFITFFRKQLQINDILRNQLQKLNFQLKVVALRFVADDSMLAH